MNKAFLIGNLTRDPEMRSTSTGVPMCSFGLAVNRRRKAEGQPDVDFFNVTAFRQLAEISAKYLAKGRKVCVVGAIQIRTYDAQDGTKRTVVDIVADDIEFMPSAQQQAGGDYPSSTGSTPPAPRSYAPAETGFTQVEEDELPF